MASSVIHLAVAKKYVQENPKWDAEKVYAGVLYPDTVKDKAISHYTDANRGSDNISHLKGKVNLFSFLQDHKNMDDFEMGWFIHLFTDYLFFDECFSKEYLIETSYDDFRRDLYYAYDRVNTYLSEKYGITDEYYKAFPEENYPGRDYEECIFSKDMLDSFIERAGSIDLDRYIQAILKRGGNLKPEDGD